jgi:hypothetical protein
MGLDTKTYWLIDRQSQCDFDLTWLDLDYTLSSERAPHSNKTVTFKQ